MKLEAVNGNLMSLTMKVSQAQERELQEQQNQQQQNEKVESQDALLAVGGGDCDGEADIADETETEEQKHNGDEAEGEFELDKETVGASGKKKGTRKKRSLNWEEAERGLLLEALKPKVDYVENRSVDAKSIKAKRLAWMQITKQFNALNFRHRSLEQIQVQWRSMKNSAKREHQQKHPKSPPVEGMDMVEFMEEMQKDPVSVRSQTRSGANGGGHGGIKKEPLLEIDDEDTPLAALPTTTTNSVSTNTNTSEDTLQTSTLALPSPPPSADSCSQHHDSTQPNATPTRNKKKGPHGNNSHASSNSNSTQLKQQLTPTSPIKAKRQRMQNMDVTTAVNANAANDTLLATSAGGSSDAAQLSLNSMCNTSAGSTTSIALEEGKYKKQLYELVKRARLAEMDYARREHEQKLRFEQMEQELKLKYCRQQEEQKLRQQREEHEQRMRHCQVEHEARLRIYTLDSRKNIKTKLEPNDGGNKTNCA